MKLSLVICVYNTAREYFEECIKSIKNSTLSPSEYEICVVDDGSQTDYSDLVAKYNLKYQKTENRGIFMARLRGIAMAEGDYIGFVDSDDTVTFNYHKPMIDMAERENLDIVMNDWAFRTDRICYWCKGDDTLTGDISAEGDEVLKLFASRRGRQHSFFVLWNKIFKRELLLRVREQLMPVADREVRYNYSEDTLMNFFIHKWAKNIKNIHTGYYFYRMHDTQSVNVVSEKSLKRQIECMSETFDIMLSNLDGNEYKDEIESNIKEWQSVMARSHYSHAKKRKYKNLYPLIKEKYNQTELKTATAEDGAAYSVNELIGENILEIDEKLLSYWNSENTVRLNIEGAPQYVERNIAYIRDTKGNIETTDDGEPVPKMKISLKNRIILNPFVYKMGMLLFKKGSKARAFLKKHI